MLCYIATIFSEQFFAVLHFNMMLAFVNEMACSNKYMILHLDFAFI